VVDALERVGGGGGRCGLGEQGVQGAVEAVAEPEPGFAVEVADEAPHAGLAVVPQAEPVGPLLPIAFAQRLILGLALPTTDLATQVGLELLGRAAPGPVDQGVTAVADEVAAGVVVEALQRPAHGVDVTAGDLAVVEGVFDRRQVVEGLRAPGAPAGVVAATTGAVADVLHRIGPRRLRGEAPQSAGATRPQRRRPRLHPGHLAEDLGDRRPIHARHVTRDQPSHHIDQITARSAPSTRTA